MNNREYLIEIILKLRSMGVKNNKILESIERLPPHYYMSFFNIEKKKIEIQELIEIIKVLEIILQHNNNLDNVLFYGVKNGWLIALMTTFCKRIYGICVDENRKNILEDLYLTKNFKNIYLIKGHTIMSWKKVAPFDFIFTLNKNSFFYSDLKSLLSLKGIAIVPKFFENNSSKMIKVDRKKIFQIKNIKYDLLNKCEFI